jgi:hypothetical protein
MAVLMWPRRVPALRAPDVWHGVCRLRFSGPWPGQHRTGVADIRLPYRTALRARGTWIDMVLPD